MKIEITLREDFTLNDWRDAKRAADDRLFEILSNTPNGERIGSGTSERNHYGCHCTTISTGQYSTLHRPHIFRVVTHGESLKECEVDNGTNITLSNVAK